jgi:hypothetical protein
MIQQPIHLVHKMNRFRNKLDDFLIDIRDFAYLMEYKKTMSANYQNRLIPIFALFYIAIAGSILYTVRAFYYLPFIKTIQQGGILLKFLVGIIVVWIPFKIVCHYYHQYYKSIPFPSANISAEDYSRKKKAYLTALLSGMLLLILVVLITVQIGYVGDGPIF